METIRRFDNRVEDYVKYRPGYPDAAIDTILGGLGDPSRLVGADIGAGTGISARAVAGRGVYVIAVEPGRVMAGAAAAHPRVHWISGTAEATGLASGSLDLIVCAQAFHWFATNAAVVEFARMLKPEARLAIMWNRRSATDAFTVGYRQAILDIGGETAAERMGFDPSVVGRSGVFTEPVRHATPNLQRLTLEGLIGRARSASYVPKEGPMGEKLIALLRTLHARHAGPDGCASLVYDAEVWLSSRR